jgi:hypothetical protein
MEDHFGYITKLKPNTPGVATWQPAFFYGWEYIARKAILNIKSAKT